MRIWLAPSAYFPRRGGVEELTYQLACELERRGHDVTVVAPRHPRDLPAQEELDGVSVARVDFSAPRRAAGSLARYPFALAAQLLALLRLRRRAAPDLVHVQCPSVQLPVITLLCWLTRTPLVLTSQGEVEMDADDLYGKSAFMRAALRWSSRRAAALTACSAWTADAAARIAPRFARARVILNGIDPAQWAVSPTVGSPILCAWGRHVQQKGFDLLIAAFTEVRAHVQDAELVIGGDGPEHEALLRSAVAGVSFVGPLDRAGVQGLLDRSRVAVVPSRLEPFGIVALEAMATGRPVVWSTIGGLRDATDGHGWGVDPHDVAALSDTLVRALTEPLPEAGVLRSSAEQRSWARITDEYLEVYDRCLRRSGGR